MNKTPKSRTREYNSWIHMRARTTNSQRSDYKYYGGKGVRVCSGWYSSFSNFYNDMGSRPEPSYSIDRIDSSLNYSCGHCEECYEKGWILNCRWSSKSVQGINQQINSRNTSGYKGVSFNKPHNKWHAIIKLNGKVIYLGSYVDLEDAVKARKLAEEKYFAPLLK